MELKVLEKLIPAMAEIINVLPGEVFHMREADTLLIMQRRMEECQLKDEIRRFNEIFSKNRGCTVDDIKEAVIAFIKIKVLVAESKKNYSNVLYKKLLMELNSQEFIVRNILQLSELNSLTASEYQRGKIELTKEKNRAFLDAFNKESLAVKEILKSMLAEDVVYEDEVLTKAVAERVVTNKEPILSKASKAFKPEKKEAARDEIADFECRIPVLDKKISFDESFVCKDMKSYSVLKNKTGVYFGLTENIKRQSYDNADQSLVEIAFATDEFLQFLEVDLIDGDYMLEDFSEAEKVGLRTYFSFVSECFKKHMGDSLSVSEYLAFMKYYNRLFNKAFDIESKKKEAYYEALLLADSYKEYMTCYDMECKKGLEVIAKDILTGKTEVYITGLRHIVQNYMADDMAKESLEGLIERIESFGKTEEEPNNAADFALLEPVTRVAPKNEKKQIIMQILNEKMEIVDEAVYAEGNASKALYDYINKKGYIKRLGLRNNGEDVFYQEIKEKD